jgi:hypothetical protein
MTAKATPRKISSTLGLTILGLIVPIAYLLWGWIASGLNLDFLAQAFTRNAIDIGVLAVSMAIFTVVAVTELMRGNWLERATSLAVRFMTLSIAVVALQSIFVWMMTRLLIPLYDVVVNVAASGILIEAFYLFLLGVAIAGSSVPTGQRSGLLRSLFLMLGGGMAVFSPYVSKLLSSIVGWPISALGGLAILVLGVAVVVLSLRSTPMD